MFACVNVNLYFSLFGLFCGRADSRILSCLKIIVTTKQSKTWRFANLFQFKVNVFSPLNEYFWLGIIGVCWLRYICIEAVLLFQMEHTGRMNGIIYILLCRNLKKMFFCKGIRQLSVYADLKSYGSVL
jgi:hypothetical protein